MVPYLFSSVFIALSAAILAATSVQALIEAPDGSVCLSGCSGHGDCVDYSCKCWLGYLGDDCSKTFADDSDGTVRPILTSGHFNLTGSTNLRSHPFLLVGFSSYSCLQCIRVESEYAKLADELKKLNVSFARADADKLKKLVSEANIAQLPALVLYTKGKPHVYSGYHSTESVIDYIQRQKAKLPYQVLDTVEDVDAFVALRETRNFSSTSVHVIGFFSESSGMEEDDFEDFVDIAERVRSHERIYMAAVTNKATSNVFKRTRKLIDRTPAVVVYSEDGRREAINLDEFIEGMKGKGGLYEWIIEKSVPLVGKITPANFNLYEKLGLPMLMMFLDLSNETMSTKPGIIVGGKSGGVLNEVLLDEFRRAAKEHVGRVSFVYADGETHKDQMRSLGLYGGVERLPSIAFNTRDHRKQVPFPESLPINEDTLLQFTADFLNGKLKDIDDTKEMAKRALQARTFNPRNSVQRSKPAPKAPSTQGVSEHFGDKWGGDLSVKVITAANFNEIAMDESKDVLLLFYTPNCEPCAHFAVYFKRMAARFEELAIESLVVARMDVSKEVPPAELNLIPSMSHLPVLVLLKAYDRNPPWLYYTGIGKVQSMMQWAASNAGRPFALPNLPHLTEKDREVYKKQVREREEYLEQKRTEEAEAEAAEDEARRKYSATSTSSDSTATSSIDTSTATSTASTSTATATAASIDASESEGPFHSFGGDAEL